MVSYGKVKLRKLKWKKDWELKTRRAEKGESCTTPIPQSETHVGEIFAWVKWQLAEKCYRACRKEGNGFWYFTVTFTHHVWRVLSTFSFLIIICNDLVALIVELRIPTYKGKVGSKWAMYIQDIERKKTKKSLTIYMNFNLLEKGNIYKLLLYLI